MDSSSKLIEIPKSVFLETDKTIEEIDEALQSLNVPVIMKPRISSVKPRSHDLLIVKDKDTLIKKVL